MKSWQKTGIDGGGDFLKICLNMEKDGESVPVQEKKNLASPILRELLPPTLRIQVLRN